MHLELRTLAQPKRLLDKVLCLLAHEQQPSTSPLPAGRAQPLHQHIKHDEDSSNDCTVRCAQPARLIDSKYAEIR